MVSKLSNFAHRTAAAFVVSVGFIAALPDATRALSFSSNQDGLFSVGACALQYSSRTSGQAHIRNGTHYLANGGWAGLSGGIWVSLIGLDVQAECGPFDGFIEETGIYGGGQPIGPVTRHGISYCEGNRLYRHGFYGETATVIVDGDQGVSPECSRPEIALSTDKSTLKSGETATVTFTLTQASDDFIASSVTTSGGTLSNFSGSGGSYSAIFTPTSGFQGVATISVADGAFTNTALRDLANIDGADANNKVTISVDTVAPANPVVSDAVANADGTVTVSGTAEPGATVTVTFPSGAVKTTTADGSGAYSATSSGREPSGNVSVTAKDAAGNTSGATNRAFSDTTAPAAPIIADVSQNNDGTVTVSGTAEPGATVTVTFTDGTSASVVANNGDYTVTSSEPQTVSGSIKATATDAAGNTSAQTAKTFSDSAAPAAPLIKSVTRQSDGSLAISGTAEPGATVKLTLPDGSVQTSTAGPDGRFSATTAPKQPLGTITAAATDSSGNTSGATTHPSQVGSEPKPPVLSTLEQAENGSLTVSGSATPGDTVSVTFPDKTTTTDGVSAGGNFSVTSQGSQPSGTVKAKATAPNGAVSAETTVSFVDTKAPQVPTPTISPNTDGTITVTGKTDAHSDVAVTLPDETTVKAKSATDGAYSATSGGAQESGKVTVVVTDAAGNSAVPVVVPYTKDVSPPAVNPDDVTVSIDGTQVKVGLVFNEPVVGLTAGDVKMTNVDKVQLTGGPVGFEVTAHMQANENVTILLPGGVATDATGNPNMPFGPLTLSTTPSVDTAQEDIAGFMHERANNLLSHQPDLIPFLRGDRSGHFNANATEGQGRFSYASAKGRRVWAELDGSWSKTDTEESRYLIGVLGTHMKVGDDVLLGGMLQIDHQSSASGYGIVTEGTGWMIGPYFVARHPGQNLYYEGRLLYGQSQNEIATANFYTDRFSTERWLAQLRLAGEYKTDGALFFPFVDARYTKDIQQAYTDSFGQAVAGQTVELGQIHAGSDFERALSDRLTWTGGITGIWSFAGGTAKSTPKFEGGRASVETGLTYKPSASTVIRSLIRYDGIGAQNYESIGLNLELSTRF